MTVDEPVDLATLAADAALFDALAAGEAAPADDEVAALLAAWRSDLAEDLPTVRSPAPVEPVVLRAPRRRRPRLRLLVGAAAAVVAAGGVTAAAASQAGPDSPLWPVTRMIFPDRAEEFTAQRDAEQTIDQAREAAEEKRYTEADKLLGEATSLIAQIDDPDVAQRLLAEVAVVRGLLPGLLPSLLPTAPAVPGAGQPQRTTPPRTGGTGDGSGGGSGQGGGGGSQPTGGGLPLPTLPPLPVTTPPLPSLPLPTCLPVVGCE